MNINKHLSMSHLLTVVFLGAAVGLSACAQQQNGSLASGDGSGAREVASPLRSAQQAPSSMPAHEVQPGVKPIPANATATAPAKFKARFKTTKGDIVLEVTRDWAPLGADRFYNLVKIGYFQDIAVFRVIAGFMAQFGIHGDPSISAQWRSAQIMDDPVKQSNARGYITYAMAGPNTRTTQFFINFGDNRNLDGMGFAPFGRVIEGMDVVDNIYNGYGEGAPRGRGPDQGRIQMQGNAYMKAEFPQLDYILSASFE